MLHLLTAPGPLLKNPDSKNALAMTMFEQHAPMMGNPGAVEFSKLFNERATKAGMPETQIDNQAAISLAAWQTIETAIQATQSLDDKVLGAWLKKNSVKSIVGNLRFDGVNNYGDDLSKLKQIQNGEWIVVWPTAFAKPGFKLNSP